MQVESVQKPLLDPYRTMGIFVSGPVTLSKSSPPVLTAPTGTSFRVYSDTLAMKVVSPPLGSKVAFTRSYNEFTYVRVEDHLLKMKYHHVVRKWAIPGTGKDSCFLCFDKLVVLAESSMLTLIDEETGLISTQTMAFKIKGMVHPVTYVNKLLLHSDKQVTLVNAIAGKVLYQFNRLSQLVQEADCSIVRLEAAPLVDIAAVALSNGTIAFLNLRKDEVVFTVRQKLAATSLGFSEQAPWMATGDANGGIILWDLQTKRILYKFESCFEGAVSSIVFMPGVPVVTCSSVENNSLKQLRINPDDSKVLTLLRSRVGCIEPLESILVNNSNQLVLSSQNSSMFMAFHSQCNNYLLPKALDSKLPYHIIARHFNVQLWKERTLEKTYKLHEYALLGKISLSCRYYVVVTAKRMVRIGGSYEVEWKIPAIKHVLLYNEHSIYAFTQFELIICDFNTSTIMARLPKKGITAPTLNIFGNLMALYSAEERTIQVWDMLKMAQGRIFKVQDENEVLCLSFSADNKFLLSSHRGGALLIWSVVEGELYKHYTLGSEVIAHCFTPDNQFMLSLFKGQTELNVWNNYLGKVSSTRQQELLVFNPDVRQVNENYRKELAMLQAKKTEVAEVVETDVLNDIPDAEDDIAEYTFSDITKWMPLVFLDEIKARNTPETQAEASSMPFFLDFRNLTEEKKKIEQEIKKETIQKKKQHIQLKDKHLKQESHQIALNSEFTQEECLQTFGMLSKLSVAEVDYQLRSFLMTPDNAPVVLRMMVFVLQSSDFRQEIKNILLSRALSLIGSGLLTEECVAVCSELAALAEPHLVELKDRVDRGISIADHHMK